MYFIEILPIWLSEPETRNAVVGFVVAAIWFLIRSDWFKEKRNKINDQYDVLIPSAALILSSFVFASQKNISIDLTTFIPFVVLFLAIRDSTQRDEERKKKEGLASQSIASRALKVQADKIKRIHEQYTFALKLPSALFFIGELSIQPTPINFDPWNLIISRVPLEYVSEKAMHIVAELDERIFFWNRIQLASSVSRQNETPSISLKDEDKEKVQEIFSDAISGRLDHEMAMKKLKDYCEGIGIANSDPIRVQIARQDADLLERIYVLTVQLSENIYVQKS